MNRNIHAVHMITNDKQFSFDPKDYSQLKFGNDAIAKKFGNELARSFFEKNAPMLLAEDCVVISSPYNHLQNAASLITKHFVDALNVLLVNYDGHNVETSIIHRKVTYTADYGFLSKSDRKKLISNDEFYLNTSFLQHKVLLFIDDVRITGTHEDILVDIMKKQNINNRSYFLYYAMVDTARTISPTVEANINFSDMNTVDDFIKLANSDNYSIVVRSAKFLLGLSLEEMAYAILHINKKVLDAIYHGCLGEGYYRIPKYQTNFLKLQHFIANGNVSV